MKGDDSVGLQGEEGHRLIRRRKVGNEEDIEEHG